MNKNFVYLFSVILLLFSCNKDFDNNTPQYPTEEILTLGIIYGYSLHNADSTWTVNIDNEEIASVQFKYITTSVSELEISPQQLGNANITVYDNKQSVIFSCKIEVEKGVSVYPIEDISYKIEVIDESYKELIEKYIKENSTFTKEAILNLTYTTLNNGDFIIQPTSDSSENNIEGTFFFDEEDFLVLNYNGKEDKYTFGVDINKQNKEEIKSLFIKDYTDDLRKKFPEAGVYKVQCIFISDFWKGVRNYVLSDIN
ncbi:MAG: hypothetical protein LBV74_11310 [Tannerella sp.]|jgi:hypothetical protein|nr:hypothetical protein [Tannerella sp.]